MWDDYSRQTPLQVMGCLLYWRLCGNPTIEVMEGGERRIVWPLQRPRRRRRRTHTHTHAHEVPNTVLAGVCSRKGVPQRSCPPPLPIIQANSQTVQYIITATRKILQYSAVQYCGSKRLTHMMSTQQKSLPTLNVMSTHVLMTPVVMYLISVCPNRVRYPLPKISK